jgi:hypothetical protein
VGLRPAALRSMMPAPCPTRLRLPCRSSGVWPTTRRAAAPRLRGEACGLLGVAMQDKDARSRQPPFAPGAGDNRQTENRTSLYDEVTEQIISDFEAGRLLWVQPWGSTATACPVLPRNALTVR